MDVWIVSIILLVTVFLLVSEKIAVDVTAIGIMAILSLTGILTPVEAVAGFANPAVITVAAMFLISQGMIRTGAVELLSEKVIGLAGGSAPRAMLLVILTGAVASAFINNTPVVVLFIPVIMRMCCRFDLSPSQYLIPMSYASILAGTCTLIGTSTNIIVSDLSARFGYGAFSMFELSKVGIPVAIMGILFLILAAPRLMPGNPNPACELSQSGRKKYLTELRVKPGSQFAGRSPAEVFSTDYPTLDVIEVIRSAHVLYPARDRITLRDSDLLLVKGDVNDMVRLIREEGLDLPHANHQEGLTEEAAEHVTVEVIVPPQSALIGGRLRESFLFRNPDFQVIGVERSGLHYAERKIPEIRLRTGDILLVWLPWKRLGELRAKSDIIVVEDVHHRILHKDRAGRAALIFGGLIVLASTGTLNIMVAALAAVFMMLVTRCLQSRDAYRALQGDVLVLIAGTIALGSAMEKTGASQLYAELFLGLFSALPPALILGGFMLLTSISTQILSNNATAVLLLPIAVSTALKMGVDPRPFIVAVCFGASACFATPIGYQTNLLVYGPGGYRFTDYMKLGIPLNVMIIITGTWLIPYFWPF
ncbi:SLC13 family permease [Desulfonema ishimotonii]|uniref:SLC13 family permease n=1 Tax=Desulfonema ishimotonii TaxID=45657 RepID=A0A401G4J2_9BACT|nr:SLC13 family permease [Desulfonema ishimotonii]GBC64136.1 SLC13 family permease [Desulfonema ishimotonii]